MKPLHNNLAVKICLPVFAGTVVLLLMSGYLVAAWIQPQTNGRLAVDLALAVLLAGCFAALAGLAVHRLVVRRLGQIAAVAQRVAAGDFSVRLVEQPTPDELGRCFTGINTLVATIEGYVAKLHELNATAEAMTNALNKDEVVRIVVEVIEKEFDVRCCGIFTWDELGRQDGPAARFAGLLDEDGRAGLTTGSIRLVRLGRGETEQAGADGPVLFVPVIEGRGLTKIMVFSGTTGRQQLEPVIREFTRTLTRLMSASFFRIETLYQITQAESKYRALFMASEGGMFRARADGVFEDINPALAAMAGYERVEDMQRLVRDTAQIFANPADQDRFLEMLSRHGRVRGFDLDLIRKDGSFFPASLSARAVWDRHGNLAAIEGFVVDLTEAGLRAKAERERAAAEAANQVKSAMLAELEHKNRQLQDSLAQIRFLQL